MSRKIVIPVVIVCLAALAIGAWYWLRDHHSDGELVLYGNADLRQADLSFNNSERITTVLVQEGDRVHKGQLLAEVDASRLGPQAQEAEAQAEALHQALERLEHGNRPEEIAEARASLASAKADAANARAQYERLILAARTSSGVAVSKQDIDSAKASLDVAEAKVEVNQKALELEVAGPRVEDIAQAKAQLQGQQAHAAYLCQQLADAKLLAPSEGTIRSRLMEPGEMASPQKPVFSLAIIDPKWIRAYVSEPDLGRVHPGQQASIMVDSFPNRRFEGFVGFISPMAEFTPKTVQTEELRTSLVYEVRVFVKDPGDELRLGMPATVYFSGIAPENAPTTQK